MDELLWRSSQSRAEPMDGRMLNPHKYTFITTATMAWVSILTLSTFHGKDAQLTS